MRHKREIHRPVDFVLAGRYETVFKLQGFREKRIIGSCNFYSTDFVPFAGNVRNKSKCILSHKYSIKGIIKSKRHKAPSVNVDVTAHSFDSSIGLGIEYRYGRDSFRTSKSALGPPSVLCIGYEVPFRGYSCRDVALTTYHNLVLRLKKK